MEINLVYDGQFIKWSDKRLTFRAISGMPRHQRPEDHWHPDAGPVPDGLYKVFIADHGVATDDGRGVCALKPSWGMQAIPRGAKAGSCEPYWANWGSNRARMEPADEATRRRCAPISRAGFYLHDSIKGYSHGCIEVETKIFKHLREYNLKTKKQTVMLQVQYIEGRPTNGGTKI